MKGAVIFTGLDAGNAIGERQFVMPIEFDSALRWDADKLQAEWIKLTTIVIDERSVPKGDRIAQETIANQEREIRRMDLVILKMGVVMGLLVVSWAAMLVYHSYTR